MNNAAPPRPRNRRCEKSSFQEKVEGKAQSKDGCLGQSGSVWCRHEPVGDKPAADAVGANSSESRCFGSDRGVTTSVQAAKCQSLRLCCGGLSSTKSSSW